MRLTVRTNLAMRVLMYCAVNGDRLVRKHDIAVRCAASENHLAQVIHLLARAGLLRTVRGRGGGLRLAHPPERVSLGAVVRLFEAATPFTACAEDPASCPLTGACRLRCVLADALEVFYRQLDAVTLADLVAGNAGLDRLLRAA